MGLLSIEIYKSMIESGLVFNYLKAIVRARFKIIRSWSRFYYEVNWVYIRFNSLSNLLIFNLGAPRASQTNYYCSLLLSILDKSICQPDNLLSFSADVVYVVYRYPNFYYYGNLIYIYIYIYTYIQFRDAKSFMNQLDHIPLFRNSVCFINTLFDFR